MARGLDRHQVLAYRVMAQGLHGDSSDELNVLTVGLQDTPAVGTSRAPGALGSRVARCG